MAHHSQWGNPLPPLSGRAARSPWWRRGPSPRTLTPSDDDDPPRRVEQLDGPTRSLVDMDPRRRGWLRLVVGARAEELSVAQNDPARREHGALEGRDGDTAVPRQLPRHALGKEPTRSGRSRRAQQVVRPLAPDAVVRGGKLRD